ncbi:MAG: hypothetical protein WCF67_20035 [Chitinophagaceae bacterium]
MRGHSLILLVVLLPFAARSQTLKAVLLNPNVYRTQINIEATRISDINGIKYNDKVLIDVEGGFMDYKIISEDENGYIVFRVLPKVIYESYNTAQGTRYRIRRALSTDPALTSANNGYNFYCAVKSDDFPPLAKTLLSTKIVGVPLVHPFKLRPKRNTEDWDIQGEFTLSYSFGIRLRSGGPLKQNFWTIILYGFGLSEDKYFKNPGDDKKDAIAITYYQGGLMHTWQKVNIGAFVSFDAMIGNKKDWFYQGRSWFSFGIGYNFKQD